MADEIPYDGAPAEVPLVSPPIAEVVEPGADLEANLEAEFEPEAELEPLPLKV